MDSDAGGTGRLSRLRARLKLRWPWARKDKDEEDGLFGRSGRVVIATIVASIFLFYILVLFVRFAGIKGDDLDYPQKVLVEAPRGVAPGEELPKAGPGVERPPCAESQTVKVLIYIVDVLVNQNTWSPGDPQYKFGWFGLASFESGPFFDNKASFQLGALSAVRRISIELVDLLGRARGTSGVDQDLQDARGALFVHERSWRINPLDSKVPFLATPAAVSYRDAIKYLKAYNERLSQCDALFDPRSDNLFNVLDRIANDVGGMTDELGTRSKGQRWSVKKKLMVEADGNDAGIFDFQADNLFYRAHGVIWAYHGILQALRYDFSNTVEQSNLGKIWDRMEQHVAETASLRPLVVSNGREDSLFQPDHLSTMAVNMLRARANMTELREILNR